MAELPLCLLLACVRAQELPRERQKEAKCLGCGSGSPSPSTCPRTCTSTGCMTPVERIPPACGPWGTKGQSCPVPGVAAMGHETLVGLPFPEVADGRMC